MIPLVPQVLASFRSQAKCPFLSVLQFSSFSDHLKRCPPHQEVRDQRVMPFSPFSSSLTVVRRRRWRRRLIVSRSVRRRSSETCARCSRGRFLLVSPRRK